MRSVRTGIIYFIRITSLAPGDIAVYPERGGKHTRIEHWNVCGTFTFEMIVILFYLLFRLLEIMVGLLGKLLLGAPSLSSRFLYFGVLVRLLLLRFPKLIPNVIFRGATVALLWDRPWV